uniref:PAS domain-containing protein n=1 Tax=Anopheles maculatus TaxID=74869 RepID=A0A182T189_9DIPT
DPPAEKATVLKLGKDAPGGKGLLPGESYEGDDRAFCIRMKSTLTKRGCHFKSSGYRVILLLCHLRKKGAGQEETHTDKQTVIGMVGIGIALPPPSLHEIKLESDMFVFRTSLDLTIIHCENRISSFLDYTADELNGKSVYSLCHGQDAHKLKKSHSELIQKGQVLTPFYRILNKNAGYFWIQSCCTMVCQTKNMSDQTVICVNYIITKPEKENLILDISQIPSSAGVLGDYHAKPLSSGGATSGAKKSQPGVVPGEYDLDPHAHHHSGTDGYHLDGGASHVDHKVDMMEKSGLGKGGLGMGYGGTNSNTNTDKKDLDYKEKLLEREKGCSNSKHQRLKSGSPMLNLPNENGTLEKKSSGGKKSVNNRASVIRVLSKPSKKVLQESH